MKLVRAGPWAQPFDAWSSMAFVVAAVVAWWRGLAISRKLVERYLAGFVAIILVLIGGSSFFYHSTLTFTGQFLDVFSMYLLGVLIIIGALLRRRLLRPKLAVIIYFLAVIGLGLAQFFWPELRRYIFALILIPGIIIELLPKTNRAKSVRQLRPLIVGVIALAVGYVVWILDETHVLCNGSIWFQGHAIWHILTAFAGFMLVLHYKNSVHPKPHVR